MTIVDVIFCLFVLFLSKNVREGVKKKLFDTDLFVTFSAPPHSASKDAKWSKIMVLKEKNFIIQNDNPPSLQDFFGYITYR